MGQVYLKVILKRITKPKSKLGLPRVTIKGQIILDRSLRGDSEKGSTLGLGELKPTSITLSLADRSVKIPRGVIEDVLVQVDKFYYPVDFVVLDTDPIVKGINYVPIILGRPFLATSNAIINCRNGVMQLTFGNMTLELNIFHLCQKHIHPEEDEGPEEVCMIDTLVEEHCNQSMLDQFEENPDESHEDLDDGLAEPMGMNALCQTGDKSQ
ncbi:hypothetical protein CK203_030211 [Vitis vinifera]|uniref:Uncharacterized protein n=1 Tax=Vitis vinifera TaxID=29760 RepID=A0A438I5A7_VITVI|nr:hypothetical protein CK203_030211 [Vitis vinifera]